MTTKVAKPVALASVSLPGLTRRSWLQTCTIGAAAVPLLAPGGWLRAQDPRVLEAARAMSALTGVELSDYWLQQTTPLLEIILNYSEVLRELNLGELEPATLFVARS